MSLCSSPHPTAPHHPIRQVRDNLRYWWRSHQSWQNARLLLKNVGGDVVVPHFKELTSGDGLTSPPASISPHYLSLCQDRNRIRFLRTPIGSIFGRTPGFTSLMPRPGQNHDKLIHQLIVGPISNDLLLDCTCCSTSCQTPIIHIHSPPPSGRSCGKSGKLTHDNGLPFTTIRSTLLSCSWSLAFSYQFAAQSINCRLFWAKFRRPSITESVS